MNVPMLLSKAIGPVLENRMIFGTGRFAICPRAIVETIGPAVCRYAAELIDG